MKRKVSESDCDDVSKLITVFQNICRDLFGSSVQSYSMHAIEHLPFLVKRFGALWAVSTAPFESAFFHLKRTLHGTRNEGKLMVERFLRNKQFSYPESKSASDDTCTSVVIGGTKQVSALDKGSEFDLYGYVLSDTDFSAFRFRQGHLVFHSVEYNCWRTSASFYAILKDETMERIDDIIQSESIICLCTCLGKTCNFTDMIDLPASIQSIVKNHCRTYSVRYGRKLVVSVQCFVGYVIVINCGDMILLPPCSSKF